MKTRTNKLISIAIFFVTFFSFTNVAYAVPHAPSPTCSIDATVLDIQSAKTQAFGPVGSGQNIEYYQTKLKITASSVFYQEGRGSCDDLANKETESILILSEYDKTPIRAGSKISAKLHFGGDEWLGGYFLSDIAVTPTETIETTGTTQNIDATEISAFLLEQKLLNSITNISLAGQSYNVNGYRYAKLFWFIPIKLKINVIINSSTKNIESAKLPWWSFLVQ